MEVTSEHIEEPHSIKPIVKPVHPLVSELILERRVTIRPRYRGKCSTADQLPLLARECIDSAMS